MEHVCTIRYKFTYYRKPELIAKICELLKAHLNKNCAGIGSLQFKYDYNRDHKAPKNQADGVPTNREANILCVEAELKIQDDDISNKLSTMMEDTPKDCMGQSLKCHYTFTKKTRMGGGMINVTLESGYKFDEKPESYLESDRDGIFSPDTFPKVNEFFRELQSKKWAHDDSPRQP